MLVLDERQQGILATLKQSMTEESNNKHMDNKINVKVNDKLHSNIINHKDITMNKINYKSDIDYKSIKRGDVLYVNLDGGKFCEQNNDRFCIVIQNDIGNTYSPTIIVAFATSQQTKAKIPTHLEFKQESLDLKRIQ